MDDALITPEEDAARIAARAEAEQLSSRMEELIGDDHPITLTKGDLDNLFNTVIGLYAAQQEFAAAALHHSRDNLDEANAALLRHRKAMVSAYDALLALITGVAKKQVEARHG